MSRDRPIEVSVGTVLVDARPEDPPGLMIAQGRVAAALFGSAEMSGVGRFQLLNRLGAGGMGVIYAAHDPQLDRTVAVKLVHVPGRDSASALAEGKALARLSHPNVVPIYDVGFAGEHLYIVMELVLGRTLGRWVKGRTVREIVKAYRQAGEALAAAHDAGLVHRDFKPENAIMGTDGRVRVVDFGLACEATDPDRPHTLQRAGAGTPKYMAPEQVVGGEITAAADQYGFCTALAEALKDCPGGTPRWLQAVIDRGAAPYPTDRFPSMTELLKALARDPARVRQRWLAGAALAAAGVAAFVAGRSTLSARADACRGGEARIAEVWGSGGRQAALSRLAGLGDYGRSVQPRLETQLQDHQTRWAAGYRNACVAHQQGVQSGALLDRRMACLERDRAALTSMAELVQTADASALPGLVLAARALPDPDACGDLDSLLTNVEPPATAIAPRVAEIRSRLAGARVQLSAGRYRQARAIAEQAVAETRTLGYAPLLAEALLLAGHATMATDDRIAAATPLTEAYTLAFQAGDQTLAVEAWARRAWAQGASGGGSASLSGLDVVEAAAAHRSVSRFARALLYNNVGSVEAALERRDRARAAFERASREAEGVSGSGAAELLGIRLNLAMITDDPVRRDHLLEQAVAENAKALGDDHPETASARWHRGGYSIRFVQAIDILAPTCPKLEAHDRVFAKRCWSEVGYLRGELNDRTGAVEAMQYAASIKVAREVDLPAVMPYLRFWQGSAGEASREFTAALQALPQRDSEPWWDRMERADLELGRARADQAAGRLRDARRSFEVAVRQLVDISHKNSYPEVDRRVGRARAELARILLAMRASPRDIAAHAAPAAAWLRRAGGLASEIDELERLAIGRPPETSR
jgi:eukaryotic-like serine/threonine-protein kinase